MGAPGEQVTGLETPSVGDARQVARPLVRRLDELYHFTLEFSFSLDNRAYQQLAELLLQVEEKRVRESGFGLGAQSLLGSDNASSAVERGDRVLSPLSSRFFPSSSI